MAEVSGLFDSTTWSEVEGFYQGNRAMQPSEIAGIIDGMITSGVLYNPDYFVITPGESGLSINIAPGIAIIRGRGYMEDTTYNKTFDESSSAREIYISIRQTLADFINERTFITDPAEGVLPVRTTDIYDLVIGKVSIPGSATTITADMITDYRSNAAMCGFAKNRLQLYGEVDFTVDTVLSLLSGNPVSNAAITAGINGCKTTSATVTLAASGWSGSAAPYTYTISNANITATNDIKIATSATSSVAENNEFAAAMIANGAQSAGSMTLRAKRTKPTIDLPVVISFGGATK